MLEALESYTLVLREVFQIMGLNRNQTWQADHGYVFATVHRNQYKLSQLWNIFIPKAHLDSSCKFFVHNLTRPFRTIHQYNLREEWKNYSRRTLENQFSNYRRSLAILIKLEWSWWFRLNRRVMGKEQHFSQSLSLKKW